MQIKISFAAAYDFNQLIHAACSPPRPLPTPQILTPSPPRPALWGRGGSPPRPVDFWPCLSPPRPVKKIASPSIPGAWWLPYNRFADNLSCSIFLDFQNKIFLGCQVVPLLLGFKTTYLHRFITTSPSVCIVPSLKCWFKFDTGQDRRLRSGWDIENYWQTFTFKFSRFSYNLF